MNMIHATGAPVTSANSAQQLSTFIPMKFRKRSGRSVVIRPGEEQGMDFPHTSLPDTRLLTGLAKAYYWQRLIDQGILSSGTEIAKKEGLDLSMVNVLLRLTLLDPRIIEDILNGRQPEGFTIYWITKNSMPVEWGGQQTKIQAIAQAEGEAE
jgi:hypothetical protein